MISTRRAEARAAGEHPEACGTAQIVALQLSRLLAGLIDDERRVTTGAATPPVALTADTDIGEEGLGFDSLARLGLVARLNRFFGLAATGIEDYLVVRSTFGDWIDLIETHFRLVGDTGRITFSTSGTTGPARDVGHDLAGLVGEARGHADRHFPDSAAEGRVLATVPAFHIYGFLFTVLLPGLAGREVVDIAALGPGAATRLARPGDLVIGTPTTWAAALAAGGAFAPGVRGVTSGAPAGADLWAGLGRAGLAGLTEVYGSTETAGVGARSGSDEAFGLLAHLERTDEGGVASRASGSPLPIQDRLNWTGPRSFRLAGRVDGAVQVGGVNIWPDRVAAWLASQAGVAEASVRLAGPRLKAFIVPDTGTGTDTPSLEASLRRAMTAGLTAPERPVRLTFGAALPRSALGKPADWD